MNLHGKQAPSFTQQASDRWQYPTVDELIDARECFKQFPSAQLGGLVDEYVVSGAEIHLHIELLIGGQRYGICVLFIAFRYLALDGRALENWVPVSAYELGGENPRKQIQAPVLVPIAYGAEGGQGVLEGILPWHSIKRLQMLQCCLSTRRGPLEVPSDIPPSILLPPWLNKRPFFYTFDDVDRELAALVLLLAGASNQGSNEIVQRGSGVVDKISEQERPIGGKTFHRHIEDILAGIRIEFTDNRFSFSVDKIFDGIPKSIEVEVRSAPLTYIVPEEIGG